MIIAVVALVGEAFALAGVAAAVALVGALLVGVTLRAAWVWWLHRRVERISGGGRP